LRAFFPNHLRRKVSRQGRPVRYKKRRFDGSAVVLSGSMAMRVFADHGTKVMGTALPAGILACAIATTKTATKTTGKTTGV
jgi:hypothetical protein